MLGELKILNSPGQKEDILFFLISIVQDKQLPIEDLRVLCAHSPGNYKLSVDNLIDYCLFFDWIKVDGNVSLAPELFTDLSSPDALNDKLIETSVGKLFHYEIFYPDMFYYNSDKKSYIFRNERLSLSHSVIRNVLLSQGFLILERNVLPNIFKIEGRYESLIAREVKEITRLFSLAQLQKKLDANTIAGEKAEQFVLEFEKRRIKNDLLTKEIRIISVIDVLAGYDIVSFSTDTSAFHDRFIEVKAITADNSFFWSRNELEVAKLKGQEYCLYLVNLSEIQNPDYEPLIIINPADTLLNSMDWLVIPETFHIRKVRYSKNDSNVNA